MQYVGFFDNYNPYWRQTWGERRSTSLEEVQRSFDGYEFVEINKNYWLSTSKKPFVRILAEPETIEEARAMRL